MKDIPYSRARDRMEALMDQVADDREPIVIRRRGKDPVALIAADDLESLVETAYLLRVPANVRRLLETLVGAAAGKGEVMTVHELRERLGFPEE